jgi:hypothetical protein
LPTSWLDILTSPKRKEILTYLIIKRRTGFTANLYKKIQDSKVRIATLPPFVERNYGGRECSLNSYDTVILFTGGVGMTHQLPYARHLVNGFTDGGAFA